MKTALFIFLFLFLFSNIFAYNIELFPKPWTYNWPITVQIKFSEPVKKLLWTKNPDWPFDETFVYEEKIKIRHTQNLWYFWILDNHISTDYFFWKYQIKVDPSRFNAKFLISKVSPKGDWIEIKNEWKFEKSLHNWVITTQNWEKTLPFFRLKSWESKKINIDLQDFMEVVRLRDPTFLTKSKIRYKSNLKENEIYFRENSKDRFLKRVFKNAK